jgi:uncharacterized protein YjbJ (UPF0337 family)
MRADQIRFATTERKLKAPRGRIELWAITRADQRKPVKGVVEGIKGKAKEVGGTLAGRNDFVEEGKAQQDKADAERDAAKKEAEAEAARGGAEAAEERQKQHQ